MVYFELESPITRPTLACVDYRATAALAARIHAQTLFHHPFDSSSK